jgi:hypothetical protein
MSLSDYLLHAITSLQTSPPSDYAATTDSIFKEICEEEIRRNKILIGKIKSELLDKQFVGSVPKKPVRLRMIRYEIRTKSANKLPVPNE